MSKLTVASLFTGIGGLDLGFVRAGFEIIWAADNDVGAVASYPGNFRRSMTKADLSRCDPRIVPNADVIIGGPPCQAFSLVGQRKPEDERGQLVFKFLDVVAEKQPSAFVMENVPGMSASRIDGSRLTDHLVSKFEDLNFCVSQLKLTATDYLTPQRRKRLFLVGARDAIVHEPDPSLFAAECFRTSTQEWDISARAALADLGAPTNKGERAVYRSDVEPSQFARLMRGEEQSVTLHEKPRMSATDRRLVRHIPPGGNYMDVPDDVATGRIRRFKETGGRTTTYGRLHPDRPAYTINTYFRRPNVGCNFHYSEDRLITPREAMRFQALPDSFTVSYTSQDQRNALIGNAVPPLMAQAVAWALKGALNGETKRVQTTLDLD